MTRSLINPGPSRLAGAPASRGGRGFSLAELLVVILILGILFVAGGREISNAWKRQKLQSASNDIKVLMQRALPEMQRRNMQTFVQIGPLVDNADGRYLPIYLIGDADQNGAIGAFANPPTALKPDLLIDEYDIMVIGKTGVRGVTGASQEFSVSTANIAEIQTAGWSANSTDWTVARAIMCDFQGRTIDVVTRRQLAAPATLVLTHTGVVGGSLGPPTRYILGVNPIWSVRIRKQTTADDPRVSTAAWVDRSGG